MAKQIRGLATVALLKANFDQGNDHLEMFLPFVVDSVANLPHDDFSVLDLQECLRATHGLSVPEGILRVLLNRVRRRGGFRREDRRYLRLTKVYEAGPLKHRLDSVTRDQTELGSAFRSYAASRNLDLKTDAGALHRCFRLIYQCLYISLCTYNAINTCKPIKTPPLYPLTLTHPSIPSSQHLNDSTDFLPPKQDRCQTEQGRAG